MSISEAVGIALCCALAIMLLKESGGKYAAAVAAFGGLALIWRTCRTAVPAVSMLLGYMTEHGMDGSAALAAKALAIGYLTQIGSDICRDLGAEGTASRLEMCGRAELLVLSLPLFSKLLETAFSLI